MKKKNGLTGLKSCEGVEDGPGQDDVVVDGQEEGGADHGKAETWDQCYNDCKYFRTN
jgi:hypothetical protein